MCYSIFNGYISKQDKFLLIDCKWFIVRVQVKMFGSDKKFFHLSMPFQFIVKENMFIIFE